jgi:hypothetical protein
MKPADLILSSATKSSLAVDVHRHSVDMAVAGNSGEDRRRDDGVPVLLGGDCVDIREQAAFDQFVELLACVELHRGRRIAPDGVVEGRGASIDAAGDGGVDPLAACLGELVSEYPDGGRFTARGSPVDDLGGLRHGGRDGREHKGCGAGQQLVASEHGASPWMVFVGRFLIVENFEHPRGSVHCKWRIGALQVHSAKYNPMHAFVNLLAWLRSRLAPR